MTGDNSTLPNNSDLFTLGEIIGSGSFSQVYKAVDKKTNNTIAIKSYRMKTKDVTNYSRAVSEMAFLRFLDHPNIIGYILSHINKEYMCLGLEYSPYGSLANFMKKNVSLCEVGVQFVMRQLLSSICYLHSMNIFHGDIKPENIIVFQIKNDCLIIKLSDFGLAEVIINSEGNVKRAGSFYYMAPEIHLGFPSDHTSDLYSAGVVMYEMLFTQKPFSTKVARDVYIANLRRRAPIVFSQPETQELSQNCLSLVKNLLCYDKSERLSGSSLASHPFLCIDLVKDEHSHYMKACETLLKSVEYVNAKHFALGYMEVTEAILHLKIHLTRICHDGALYQYTFSKLNDYIHYSQLIEEKLTSNINSEPINIGTQSEKLRCLLKSTPALLNGYDICSVGEMYYIQRNVQEGTKKLKDGLNILFPIMANEPSGLRKHLLTTKMEQWINMLETMKKFMEVNANRSQ